MTASDGQVFGAGIRILLKGANDALTASAGPVAYLHFVDPAGNTIVPEYQAAGLSTFAGPLSGAKITIPSAADFAALEARVVALESQLAAATSAATPNTLVKRDSNGDIFVANLRGNIKESSAGVHVKILASDGQEVARLGLNGGNPALRFFYQTGEAMAIRQGVDLASPTLAAESANALVDQGLFYSL